MVFRCGLAPTLGTSPGPGNERRSALSNADGERAVTQWHSIRNMPGTVQSIERAAAILRMLAGGTGRLGLGEIARSLDLAKGTTHGILRTLQHVGFVEQDRVSGRYQLGAALLHLGTS